MIYFRKALNESNINTIMNITWYEQYTELKYGNRSKKHKFYA